MKYIHLSDTHFLEEEEDELYGINPAHRLRKAIESANRSHGDAAFMVITGDLVDNPSLLAYKLLKTVVVESKIPVYLMLGNHDNRDEFGSVFPEFMHEGYCQYELVVGGNVFLFLDTLVEGQRYGEMDERRLLWLSASLEKYRETPIYLFMHHHPVSSGLYEMDNIAQFKTADRFWEIVESRPNVRHIAFGHLHRIMHAQKGSISMHSCRSTTFQVAYQPDSKIEYLTNKENPSYAVVEILGDGIARIHHHEYLYEDSFYEDDAVEGWD